MRHSVDIIATYDSSKEHFPKQGKIFVIIRRLSFPAGLAFPGGGIEEGESKDEAGAREFTEETGLNLVRPRKAWLPKVYDTPGRDPRGPATSYVAYGTASGDMKHEEGKTEVLLLSEEEILMRGKEFVFDHFQMFLDYQNHLAK